MSSIIVEFPDCAKLGSHEEANTPDDVHDTITVYTENCPAALPGPAPMFGVGEIIAAVFVSLAFIVGVAMVRYRAHEMKPEKLAAKNKARQIELDAQVQMAAQRKHCTTCGDVYEPAIKGADE